MNSIAELLSYSFFQHAILSAILTSISCGLVGTYIVSKRLVFISGGITHASFGGIGIAYYFGIYPIFGAIFFGILSALGVEFFSRNAKIREDSAIGILWSFGMAIGIIFIFLVPGYAPNLMSFLFGSILTIKQIDLYMLLILSVIIILFFTIYINPIIYVAFDEEYAKTRQLPVLRIKYFIMALIALTIVLNIKVIGIILVISMLTIPQNIANLFTNNFITMSIASVGIAFIGNISGLIFSYFVNIPSGPAIIFSLVIIFAFSKLTQLLINKYKSALVRNKKERDKV